MTLIDELEIRSYIVTFGEELQKKIGKIPDVPEQDSIMAHYSYWFSVINFVIQLESDSHNDMLDKNDTLWLAADRLSTVLAATLSVPLVSLPSPISMANMGNYSATLSAATANDNWCRKSPHANQAKGMEIIRRDSPELEMECPDFNLKHKKHKTTYEVTSQNYLKKM